MCDMCRKQIEDMLRWASGNVEYLRFAQLFLCAYISMLRVPSEALPATTDQSKVKECQSVIWCEGDQLHLNLLRRKNKPCGSRLRRQCWCNQSPGTCPVHILGPIVAACPKGARLFEGITAAEALATLRHMLEQIGVKRPHLYRLHDIRRGHAKDLQLSGQLNACAVLPGTVCAHE